MQGTNLEPTCNGAARPSRLAPGHGSPVQQTAAAGNLAAMASVRSRSVLYWATQVVAWSGYMLLLGLPTLLDGGYTPRFGLVTAVMVVIGLAASHALRICFKDLKWLDLPLGALTLRMVAGAIALGAIAGVLQAAIHDAAFPGAVKLIGGNGRRLAEVLLSWVVQLFVWSVAYVAYHYIVSSRLEKMRALRLEAANREGQLASLRSQLNPHFMFNALNSIRALIGEDPDRAQRAITLLSSLLRNAMSTVKRRTVPLGEEVDTVRAYLTLESMRYEERLRVRFLVDPALERRPVPPMMLQTLVENAVRHGIAKRKQGGEVEVEAKAADSGMVLTVRNSGHLQEGATHGSGIGLRNTRERLAHLYAGKARLDMRDENGMVVCELYLPATLELAEHEPYETETLTP